MTALTTPLSSRLVESFGGLAREDPAIVRARIRRQRQMHGFGELLGAASESEMLAAPLLRALQRNRVPEDPNYRGFFSLPQQTQKELMEGLPLSYQRYFAEARSVAELHVISNQLKRLWRGEQILQANGWAGLTARRHRRVRRGGYQGWHGGSSRHHDHQD